MCEKKIFAVNSFQGNRLMIKMTFNSNFKIIRSRCRLLSPLSLLSHSTGTWLIFYLKTFFCPYPAISLISRNLSIWMPSMIVFPYLSRIQNSNYSTQSYSIHATIITAISMCSNLVSVGHCWKRSYYSYGFHPPLPKKITKKLINQDFARSYYLSVLTSHILL